MQTFYSNGKLLLTAEYLVLFGAKALALPTKKGQNLLIRTNTSGQLNWNSFDEHKKIWFTAIFTIADVINNVQTNDAPTNTLVGLLHQTYKQNPAFWEKATGFNVETYLDFNKNWGLGSSSTLLNNVANWTQTNAYKLLQNTFTGSGYDLACAQHNYPIQFQIKATNPEVTAVNFNPPFKDQLYFVYLNQKQNSKNAIKELLKNKADFSEIIAKADALTEQIKICDSLADFMHLINEHENLLSEFLQQPKVKDLLFADFNGSIKSLGAWGGDFVLAASPTNPTAYFKNKGYSTIISYQEMIL